MNSFSNIHTHKYSNNGFEIINVFPDQNKLPESYFSIGIHPWYIDESNISDELYKIEKVFRIKNCLAIGECGLDKNSKIDFKLQIEVFKMQLNLAQKHSKPVIIHCVKSFDELIKTCKPYMDLNLIIHGFNKNYILGEQLINYGFYLSFGKAFLIKKDLKKIYQDYSEKIFFENDDDDFLIDDLYIESSRVMSKSIDHIKIRQYKKVKKIFNVR